MVSPRPDVKIETPVAADSKKAFFAVAGMILWPLWLAVFFIVIGWGGIAFHFAAKSWGIIPQ